MPLKNSSLLPRLLILLSQLLKRLKHTSLIHLRLLLRRRLLKRKKKKLLLLLKNHLIVIVVVWDLIFLVNQKNYKNNIKSACNNINSQLFNAIFLFCKLYVFI